MTRKRLELTGFSMALIAIVLALLGGRAISGAGQVHCASAGWPRVL